MQSQEYLLYLIWEHHISKFKLLQVVSREGNPLGNLGQKVISVDILLFYVIIHLWRLGACWKCIILIDMFFLFWQSEAVSMNSEILEIMKIIK